MSSLAISCDAMQSVKGGASAPVAAMLRRYMERQGVSLHELERRTGRSRQAIRDVLDGESIGMKPWQGQRLLILLQAALSIPDREVQRALTAHNRAIGEADLSALTTSRKAGKRRASSSWQRKSRLGLVLHNGARDEPDSLPVAASA